MDDARVILRGEFDTSDIKRGSKEVESSLSSLGKKVQNLAIGTIIAKGFQLAYKACMECVSAFSEAQVAVTKFETVAKTIGFSNEQISNLKNYASEIQNLTGMSDEAVLGAEQLLLATNALDEDGIKKATLSCADLAVAMGTDITSSAQALAIALESPSDGLTRLRRSGILFTDEEESLVKSLEEAGKKAEAQEVILSKIQERYEGVAKAVGDTNTGTLDKISETWGDIKENLGEAILNSIQPALNALLTTLNAISAWSAGMKNQEVISAMSGAFGTFNSDADLSEFSDKALADALSALEAEYSQTTPTTTVGKGLLLKIGKLRTTLNARGYYDESTPTTVDTGSGSSTTVTTQTVKTYKDFDAQLNDLQETYKHYKTERDKAEQGSARWLYYDQFMTEAKSDYQSMVSASTYATKEDTTALDNLTSLLASYSDTYQDNALLDQIEQLEKYGETFPEYADEIAEAIDKIRQSMVKDITYNASGSWLNNYGNGGVSQTIADIKELRDEISKSLEDDPNADVSAMQTKLNSLYASLESEAQPIINSLASSFEYLGEALAGNEVSWGDWAKSVLDSIASVISSHGYEMLAEGTLKLFNPKTASTGVAEVAKSAGIIALAGVVKGLGNSFETGGIVGGSGITGDHHMIFANAGELILNKTQQRTIASQLSNGVGNPISINFSGTVLGDQESISSWVYDGVQRAKANGVIA